MSLQTLPVWGPPCGQLHPILFFISTSIQICLPDTHAHTDVCLHFFGVHAKKAAVGFVKEGGGGSDVYWSQTTNPLAPFKGMTERVRAKWRPPPLMGHRAQKSVKVISGVSDASACTTIMYTCSPRDRFVSNSEVMIA